MRNYQPKKNNEYKLDHVLFVRMISLVKDYGRMKAQINDILNGSSASGVPMPDGQYADPTLHKVIKIQRISEECKAVEWALEQIPAEYRTVIFNKICYDRAYPIFADPATYSRWKCRFLYFTAKKLMYF